MLSIHRHRPRSLSAGAFFGRSLSVFGTTLPQFLVIGLLVLSPLSVLEHLAFAHLLPESDPDLEQKVTALLWQLLVRNLLAGALVFGVLQKLDGERADLGACLSQVFRRLPIILGVTIGFGILCGTGILGIHVLMLERFSRLGRICMSLAFCAWFFAVFLLALPVAVVEGGFVNSFRRSLELTRGHRWKILGALLLSFASSLVVLMVGGILVLLPTWREPEIAALATFPIKVLAWTLQAILPSVIYHDLRSEKDGVGVEELRRVFS